MNNNSVRRRSGWRETSSLRRLLKRLCHAAIKLVPVILAGLIIRFWLLGPIRRLSLLSRKRNLILPNERSSPRTHGAVSATSVKFGRAGVTVNESTSEVKSVAAAPQPIRQKDVARDHLATMLPTRHPTPKPPTPQLPEDTRNCTSPEKDVIWPMGRSENPSGRSRTSSRTCDVCLNNTGSAGYLLSELANLLKVVKRSRCRNLVIYSVAFGEPFHSLYKQDDLITKQNVKEMIKIHDRCFITFTLKQPLKNSTSKSKFGVWSASQDSSLRNSQFGVSTSPDLMNTLFRIDPVLLPYRSLRRNVKLLKMNPHHLFPWAKYVIFQDAKFRQRFRLFDYPVNFHHHINRTLKATQTCASFQAITYTNSSMVDLDRIFKNGTLDRNATCPASYEQLSKEADFSQDNDVAFAQHCEKIVEVSYGDRPNVTDDVSAVLSQCMRYLMQYGSADQNVALSGGLNTGKVLDESMDGTPQQPEYQMYPNSAPQLDRNLIDSALMVWDFKSDGCFDWIADLLCTWLDEIHCFSDRDQLSFPYTVAKMGGLKVIHGNHTQTTHRVLADAVRPRMLVVKGHCSWVHHHCYHEEQNPWRQCEVDVPSGLGYAHPS